MSSENLSQRADYETSKNRFIEIRGDLYGALYQLKEGGTEEEINYAANEVVRCQRDLWQVVKDLFDAITDEPTAAKMDQMVGFIQADENELVKEFRILYYGEEDAADTSNQDIFLRTLDDDLREQALIHAHRDYVFDETDIYANAIGLNHLQYQPDGVKGGNYAVECYAEQIDSAIGQLIPEMPQESQDALDYAWKVETGEINPYEPTIRPAEALTTDELSKFNAIWGNYDKEQAPEPIPSEEYPPFDLDRPEFAALRTPMARLDIAHNRLMVALEQAAKSHTYRRKLLKKADEIAQEVNTAFHELSDTIHGHLDTRTGAELWKWIFSVNENKRAALVKSSCEWQEPYTTVGTSYYAEAAVFSGDDPFERPLNLTREDALKAHDDSVNGTVNIMKGLV